MTIRALPGSLVTNRMTRPGLRHLRPRVREMVFGVTFRRDPSGAKKSPGAAATRKLLRSVAWKGTVAVVCEALAAARVAGAEDWMRAEILGLLSSADESTLQRMEDGSRRHALRRAHEMTEVGTLLRELGVAPHMSDAARAQLEDLQADG